MKDIAELLDWPLRHHLRDDRVTSLIGETGAGDWDMEFVSDGLITRLHKRANESPDEKFKKASVHLFAELVSRERYALLNDFPMYSERFGNDDRIAVIKLIPNQEVEEVPLAPVLSWIADLQPYARLFPNRYILSNEFFDVVPDTNSWHILEERRLLKRDVLFTATKSVEFRSFLPDEPLTEEIDHSTFENIAVTNLAFLTKEDVGILPRVRQSRRLARIFWDFLTKWVIVHDSNGLNVSNAVCLCGISHDYFSAEWLVPLATRMWVPLGDQKSGRPTAGSLAIFLQNTDLEPNFLSEK